MKEVFEKIIDRLEEEKEQALKLWDGNSRYKGFCQAIEIVNQVAEEYSSSEKPNMSDGKDTNVRSNLLDDLKIYLKNLHDYNSEQADIYRDVCDKDAYFRAMKDTYMDRANCYGRVIEFVADLERKYGNDSWIPCSERLPENSDIHEVTAQFVNGKCYTEFAYYDLVREEWWKHDDDGIVNVIAWKKSSKPYQLKGEK